MREPSSRERSETAAGWVLRLREPDLPDATATEWIEWCEADPRNRAAFEAMAELWEVSGGLAVAGLVSEVPQPANDRGAFRDGRRRNYGLAALAATIIAIFGSVLLLKNRPQPLPAGAPQVTRLETALGRVQATTLEDGTRIELGGRSSLSVHYTPERRVVVADQGEAFFNVARNPERPFVVQAGAVTVTAVGTAFSVQRDGNSVAVTVTEGVVEVRATPNLQPGGAAGAPAVLRVAAGHRVRFDRGELTQSVEPVQPDIVAPWRQGRLEFRDEPLRLVVARINRYSQRQLEISDPSIADLRLTTTVYHDRVDAWLQGLALVLPVRVSTDRNRATISPAS